MQFNLQVAGFELFFALMLKILLLLVDPTKAVVFFVDLDTYLPNTPVDR